eukprot:snap_masked-scaffold_5-processed-gene-13.39-mRNA-1 protein AED:1.00 eAED:1.00 QI:0/0/0/0/1/1/2/0/150
MQDIIDPDDSRCLFRRFEADFIDFSIQVQEDDILLGCGGSRFQVGVEVVSPALVISWFSLSSCLVLFLGAQRNPSQSGVFEVRREHLALILGGVVGWVGEGSSGSRRSEWGVESSQRHFLSYAQDFVKLKLRLEVHGQEGPVRHIVPDVL